METIVVTGGAGFIGCNFVRLALVETDAHIIVVDKLTYAGNLCSLEDLVPEPRYNFLKGDITDRDFVESLFRNHQPTWILNFAAETHVDRSIDDPRPFIATNVVGISELLEYARIHHSRLQGTARERFRFLHVSTDEVYGTFRQNGKFSEITSYAPNSPYAASKAAADHIVRAYYETYRLPTITTNCSNNYGPYQFPEKLIPLILLNAIEGKPLPIYGDGGNIRDWLYVEDHCSGILLAIQRGLPGARYNIGGDNERTNLEIVDEVCSCLEKLFPATKNPAMLQRGIFSYTSLKTRVPDRPGHDRHYSIDSNKIRRELGWTPRHNLKQGIDKTVRWYYEHQAWCRKIQENSYDGRRLGLEAKRKS